MKLTKNILLSAVADLVQMLSEYGCENDSIIHTLMHYGFTKEQIKEWYGIENE